MGVGVDTLRRLAALRLDPEAMAEVLSIIADMQSVDDARKAKDRDRKRNIHGKSEESPRKVHGNGAEIPPQGLPPVSPDGSPQRDIIKPLSLTPSSPIPNSSSAQTREDFDRFWQAYPNKVGKPVAMKSFERIAKHDFAYSLDEILEGLDRYKRSIGDKPWLNPSTFLNQRRWEDQPAAQARAGPREELKFKNPWIIANCLAHGFDPNESPDNQPEFVTIDADPVKPSNASEAELFSEPDPSAPGGKWEAYYQRPAVRR